MVIRIQRAELKHACDMQQMNLMCLPENYQLKYYVYHLFTWPELSYVAYDDDGCLVGYVLCKVEEDLLEDSLVGHVTSLAVKLSYRRLGIAKSLMEQAERDLAIIYNVKLLQLHVRVSNYTAIHLYEKSLHFKKKVVEDKYYGDGENAYVMEKTLDVQKHKDQLIENENIASSLFDKIISIRDE